MLWWPLVLGNVCRSESRARARAHVHCGRIITHTHWLLGTCREGVVPGSAARGRHSPSFPAAVLTHTEKQMLKVLSEGLGRN